jgi:hypothetical protein
MKLRTLSTTWGVDRQARSSGSIERVFDKWESDPEYPTLFPVDREVMVSTAEALPSSGRKLAGQPPVWVRAFGLQIEPRMTGRQVAWVRRSNGGWLAGPGAGASHQR